MVTLLILFSVYVAFVSTAEERERSQCTLSIFENTTNSQEFQFYEHVERFFQKHEMGKVLSGFLDKGDLTVGIRYIITTDNAIKLKFLRITAGSGEKDFFVPAVHDTSKKIFLKSVKNSFYTVYNDKSNSDDKSSVKFDTMLEDSIINSYFKKIRTRPLIIYTEMLVTNVGVHVNLIEISSADNENCFLNQSQQPEKHSTQAKLETRSSYQSETQVKEQENHRIHIKTRSLSYENEKDESELKCVKKRRIAAKDKIKSLCPSKKHTKKTIKPRIHVNNKITSCENQDKRPKKRRIPTRGRVSCKNEEGKTKGRNEKKCRIPVKGRTKSSCQDGKQTRNKNKRVLPVTPTNYFPNKDTESEQEEGHEYDSNDETDDKDEYDVEKSSKAGKRDAMGKPPASQSDSVLYQLIRNEINRLGKNKGPSPSKRKNQPEYNEAEDEEEEKEEEEDDDDEAEDKFYEEEEESGLKKRNVHVKPPESGTGDDVLYQLIMNEIDRLHKNKEDKHEESSSFKRGKAVRKKPVCDETGEQKEIGVRAHIEKPSIGERSLIREKGKFDGGNSSGYGKNNNKKIKYKKSKGTHELKLKTRSFNSEEQTSLAKAKSFTIVLDKFS